MPDFTLSPQTSVSEETVKAAVEADNIQLERIEGKLDRILSLLLLHEPGPPETKK